MDDDYRVIKRASELRTERNVLLGIGFGMGIVFAVIFQAICLWVVGIL